MSPISEPTSLDQPSRRAWQAPRVIHSELADSEAKAGGLATPDSHFGSIDYGNIPS
jgi:hypothetical protein